MRATSASAEAVGPTPPRWLGVGAWALTASLSLYVAVHGLSYLFGAQAPPLIEDNGMGMTVLAVHAGSAGVALLIGPLQFIKFIRERARPLHRWIGRFYLIACLLGGVTGGLLAPFTAAGPMAGAGFLLLGLLWLWVNWLGWRAAAIKRDFGEHENWMIRSFALTLAAVTLRLYLPAAVLVAGLDFVTAYKWIAWLCWIPNCAIAEAWIALRRHAHPLLRGENARVVAEQAAALGE